MNQIILSLIENKIIFPDRQFGAVWVYSTESPSSKVELSPISVPAK